MSVCKYKHTLTLHPHIFFVVAPPSSCHHVGHPAVHQPALISSARQAAQSYRLEAGSSVRHLNWFMTYRVKDLLHRTQLIVWSKCSDTVVDKHILLCCWPSINVYAYVSHYTLYLDYGACDLVLSYTLSCVAQLLTCHTGIVASPVFVTHSRPPLIHTYFHSSLVSRLLVSQLNASINA